MSTNRPSDAAGSQAPASALHGLPGPQETKQSPAPMSTGAFIRAASLSRRSIGQHYEGERVQLVVTKGAETMQRDGQLCTTLSYLNLDEPPVVAADTTTPGKYLKLRDTRGNVLLWITHDDIMPLLATPDPSVISATLTKYSREDRPGHTHNFVVSNVVEHHYPFDADLTAKIASHTKELKASRIPGAPTLGQPPVPT